MGRFQLAERSEEALLDRHAAFREASDWYRRTGGDAAADEAGLQRLLPWLQILVPRSDGSPYLWCGERTPPAELWGEEVALGLVGSIRLPDGDFDRAVSSDFLQVRRTGRPLAQAARGPLCADGVTRLLHWHRLILPLDFSGFPAVATLAIFDHDRRQSLD